MHSIAASRLADSIRAAVAAHTDFAGSPPGSCYVTVRLHESDVMQLDAAPTRPRSVVVRRLYTGRNKALENDALWDVLVGAELTDGALLRGAFTYPSATRVSVRVSAEPPVDGADAFEGVFGWKGIPVPGIR